MEWTIKQLLDWITQYFDDNNIDSARLSAELLLAEILQMQRIELYTNFDKLVQQAQRDKLRDLVKRCGAGEPLQYLIGRCEFYSMAVKVTPDCLIPRPETELLVERAIEFLRAGDGAVKHVCDLCSGSGCIAVAIGKNFENAHIIATDISDTALAVAAENVARYELENKVELLCGDLFDPIIDQLDGAEFDLIVTNPPYVSTDEFEALEEKIKNHEPSIALHAGADGLDVYRRIIADVGKHLKAGGALMMEIGCNQGQAIRDLLAQAEIFGEITIEKDLSDNDRIVTARKHK